MIGDGVEAGYLSPFLVSRGISEQQAAVMFTVYGIVVAIAAWFSSALSDLWGSTPGHAHRIRRLGCV